MALLFCDSFDHYTTLAEKWTVPGSPTITANGRFGSGLRAVGGVDPATKTLPAAYATLVCGFAIRNANWAQTCPKILSFRDGTSDQVRVGINGTNQLTVKRGDEVLLGTSSLTMVNNVWYYIELKATIHATTGSYELRIDGVVRTSGTGLDTNITANNSADGFGLGGDNNSVTRDFDDVYICDTAGTLNNDFLGDIRVEAIYPNANGNYSQFVGSDLNSTDNYLLVDEATPNSDTDYVETPTVNNIDTYAYGNITPTTATVRGIQFVPYWRKVDAGTRTVAPIIRQGTTDYVQANLPNLSTTYQILPQIRETSPATAAAWTVAEINALEAGYKVIA